MIKIGNSKGIRLPKMVLDKYAIGDKLELILEDSHIVLKPKNKPRRDWEKSFKAMHENGDDDLLIEDFFDDETFEEWK